MQAIYQYIYIAAMLSIWVSVAFGIMYVIGGILYIVHEQMETVDLNAHDHELPTVTIMIPAHNEEIVIATTVENVFHLNYPQELVQLIVINDNSSDNTGLELARMKEKFPDRDFTILTTDAVTGGKGKSLALNNALKLARNEWICIFDGDAAPEKNTLRLLVLKTFESKRYAAVYGRNKARNRSRNILTKFINLELVTSQRIIHTGRWFLFKIGQIPGTNFIVRRDIMVELGGWDTKAITEDTDLGFTITKMGYLIALESRAEAYQQEPERVSVYIKQRTRWAKGNYYVVVKNFKTIFSKISWRVKFEVIYYFLTYYFFLSAVIIADLLMVLWIGVRIFNVFVPGVISPEMFSLSLDFNFALSFFIMIAIYVIQINIALASDVGQSTLENFVLSFLSYFTYAQLWLVISVKAVHSFVMDSILKREAKWYKTERF